MNAAACIGRTIVGRRSNQAGFGKSAYDAGRASNDVIDQAGK